MGEGTPLCATCLPTIGYSPRESSLPSMTAILTNSETGNSNGSPVTRMSLTVRYESARLSAVTLLSPCTVAAVTSSMVPGCMYPGVYRGAIYQGVQGGTYHLGYTGGIYHLGIQEGYTT